MPKLLTIGQEKKIKSITENTMDYLGEIIESRLSDEIANEMPNLTDDQLDEALPIAIHHFYHYGE